MQHRRLGGGPGDRLGGVQGERAREDRQPPEYPPLILVEQLIAPVHGRRQRPLPGCRRPVTAGQQHESVIQPLQQLREAQRLGPGRGQLDRQRHPVQPRHDLRHQRARLAGQGERRVGLPGPVGEQRHRLRPGGPSRIIRLGQRQGRQPAACLSRDPDRLPAGRQHPHIIGGGQQRPAQLRDRRRHVLAVVQHQQQLPPGQHPGQRLREGRARRLMHLKRHRHRRRDQRRLLDSSQLDQPHPVGEPARYPPGHLTGQPGLAHPARPGHRHHPVLSQQPGDLVHRGLPADETRQRRDEPMHAASSRYRSIPHSPYPNAAPRRPPSLFRDVQREG